MANYFESGIGNAERPVSSPEDYFEMGQRAALQALSEIKQFQPRLALVFVSSKLDIEKVTHGVKDVLKTCPVIGTSTTGTIAMGASTDSVVVSILASPHMRVKIGVGKNVGQNHKKAVFDALFDAGVSKYFDSVHPEHQMLRMTSESAAGPTPALLIVFTPGTTKDQLSESHDIHSILRKSSANRIPIFGGSSSDNFVYEPNHQIINDVVFTDAIVLAFIETDVLFGLGMSHGFIPTKKRVMVTEASGHSIHEIDKRPAVDVYAELLKMTPAQMREVFQVGEPPFKHFPFGSLDMYGNSILHVPEKLLDNGSIQFAHIIENSRVLSLMRARQEDERNACVTAYEKAVKNGGLRNPSLIMIMSCALRIKDQENQEDIRRVNELANIPICGVYTYGEKGALDDGLLVYNNQSVSTLVFSDELNPIASMVNNNKKIFESFNLEIDKKTIQIHSISKIYEIIQKKNNDVGKLLTSLSGEISKIFPWAYVTFYLAEGNSQKLALASAVDFDQFPINIRTDEKLPGFHVINLDSHEKSFGALVLKFKDTTFIPSQEDIQLGNTIASLAANGLHQIDLDGNLAIKLQRFEILNQIGHELATSEGNNLPSENILRHIQKSLNLSFVSFWQIDRPHQLLAREAFVTRDKIKIGQMEQENDKRIAKWQAEFGKPIFHANDPGAEFPLKLVAPFHYSFVSLPIKLKGDLKGILNLFSHRQYKWTHQTERVFENMEFLQTISTQIAMFIENRSLQKHSTFYKEIHHRVKNNLQNIASLLRMQRRRLDRVSADQALSDSISRIMSIAMVHDTLSHGEIGLVDLRQLMASIIKFCQSEVSSDINISLDVSQTLSMIPSREATSLSLVVNELVLNAIQHGLKDRNYGKLQIKVEQQKDITLTIIDDGPGLPDTFSVKKDGNLGLTIVQTLVKDELKGSFQMEGSNGTRAIVSFPTQKSYYHLPAADPVKDHYSQQIKHENQNDKKRFRIGGFTMTKTSPLKDKIVLIVDDETDILETVEEELDMCLVHKAADFDTATQHLASYTYDIVVLDIMGVNGFELLKDSVRRGFPTVMLTAHALTPDALKKSIKLGAVFFLPKDKLFELPDYLGKVVLKKQASSWSYLFSKFGDYFNRRFGPDWKEKDQFFKEFEKSLLIHK